MQYTTYQIKPVFPLKIQQMFVRLLSYDFGIFVCKPRGLAHMHATQPLLHHNLNWYQQAGMHIPLEPFQHCKRRAHISFGHRRATATRSNAIK